MPVSMMHGAHSGRRRRALVGILAALALPLGCALSHAAYPERVITLIVPFPAGGPTTSLPASFRSVCRNRSVNR